MSRQSHSKEQVHRENLRVGEGYDASRWRPKAESEKLEMVDLFTWRESKLDERALIVEDWKTVATEYPVRQVRTAMIARETYKEGLYHMCGVDGYKYFYCKKDIPVTVLRINNSVVMPDDPLHWIGMQRLAEASVGRVLVIGLGLGLVVHHLVKNLKVTQIDVVEINPDVIELVEPLLPQDPRITVILGNGLLHSGEYETVLVDILVRSQKERDSDPETEVRIAGQDVVVPNMFEIWLEFKMKWMDSFVYLWDMAEQAFNPAVIPRI
jgi:hypothetical protein